MLSWTCILCGYELHAQAVSLVQAQRTRPSVARNAQSLRHPRVGVHAAADTGEQGVGLLSQVFEALSHDRFAGTRPTQGGDGSLGWLGLLRACSQSPQAGSRGERST